MDQVRFKDLVKLFDELRKKYPVEEIMGMAVKVKDHKLVVVRDMEVTK